MEFKAIKNTFHEVLEPLFSADEINVFFYRLAEAYCGYSRLDLALQPHVTASPNNVSRFMKALSYLEKEKPIQYILNKTNFYGLEFYVDERVLIPRLETEVLTDRIINDIRQEASREVRPLRILDIGTGSGCIAVTLAKQLPEARVYALDNSGPALEVARKNAAKHQVVIEFIKADALKLDDFPEKLDCVVSNPPYVRRSEKAQMKNNVVRYEPHSALFVPDEDPLVFYKKTAAWAMRNLTANGVVYFEINQYLGQEIKQLIKNEGFSAVELQKDLSGNDRIVKAVK